MLVFRSISHALNLPVQKNEGHDFFANPNNNITIIHAQNKTQLIPTSPEKFYLPVVGKKRKEILI